MTAPKKSSLDFKTRLAMSIIRPTVSLTVRFIAWSLKMEFKGLENLKEALASGRPVILITWHGNLFNFVMASTALSLPPIVSMVSRSKDGEIVAGFGNHFGFRIVRGSSSRGGALGLLEFQREMKKLSAEGRQRLAIHFLDGPRGPRHQSKPGILAMALLNDALLVPIEFGISHRKKFQSWDRHRIAYPFARMTVLTGPPIDLKAERETAALDEPAEIIRDQAIKRIEDAIRQIAEADDLCRADY